MDLEVVGRHALLFDDDATAAFVNSPEALVEWFSLPIDRYDVRHLLLQPPPPPSKRRRTAPILDPDGVSRADLDRERFQDLPPDDGDDPLPDEEVALSAGGTYQAVGFSYDNPDASGNYKTTDPGNGGSSFRPPFTVPENLLNSLPPTEKLHQIIARTAKFVGQHGGQSEIVLRVKQGDNPTFGFLMPDHYLHPYFRFLVDNQELLNPKTVVEPEEAKSEGGALLLLGSTYGKDDDWEEDEAKHQTKETTTNNYGGTSDLGSHMCATAESSVSLGVSVASDKTSRKKASLEVNKAAIRKRETDLVGPLITSMKPPRSSISSIPEDKSSILEPPSSLKQMVDRIVEFVIRNGKEVEAVLIQQNKTSGNFSFLLPANQYHPYYLKALQKAHEAKLSGRVVPAQNCNAQELDKESASLKNQFEGTLDTERKEKFKMTIGASKKESQERSAKTTSQQCGMSADAAAAIVMAATRGLKIPGLDVGSKVFDSVNAINGGEGGNVSSLSSFSLHQVNGSIPKPLFSGDQGPAYSSKSPELSDQKDSNVSFAKAMAKSAALAAADEADSAEAGLTKEQKQKAERLKRAKMFAAMVKVGAQPSSDLLTRTLVPTPDSALSDASLKTSSGHSGGLLLDRALREKEGSLAALETKMPDAKVGHDDSYGEQPSRKSRSSRSKRYEEEDVERDHKHSRKRQREHSSHHERDDYRKHKKSHSSSRRKESKRRHRHDSSSEDEHRSGSRSHRRRPCVETEREPDAEIEVNENLSDNVNVTLSSEHVNMETSSQSVLEKDTKVSNDTEIPDDLRAKVRAMLLATL